MTRIEKHEKAIRVLENIDIVTRQIEVNEKCLQLYINVGYNSDYRLERLEIDTKIKERLENYYNKNFKNLK